MDEVVRRVLDHLDLFDDHLLLAVHIVRVESRVEHDVGQDVERQRKVLVEDLDVVGRVLLGRERVQLAADRVHGLGDLLGAAAGGPLEEHVLDEVGDAGVFVRLVARAAREPDAHCDRSDVGHRFAQQSQPGVEGFAPDRRRCRPGVRGVCSHRVRGRHPHAGRETRWAGRVSALIRGKRLQGIALQYVTSTTENPIISRRSGPRNRTTGPRHASGAAAAAALAPFTVLRSPWPSPTPLGAEPDMERHPPSSNLDLAELESG